MGTISELMLLLMLFPNQQNIIGIRANIIIKNWKQIIDRYGIQIKLGMTVLPL